MTRWRLWVLPIVGIAALAAIIGLGLGDSEPDPPPITALGEAIEGANRVELWWFAYDTDPTDQYVESVFLSDPGAVASLIETLSYNHVTVQDVSCECMPSWGYNIYRDGAQLAHLSVEHEYIVTWSGWPTGAAYPGEAGQELVDLASEHGLPFF